jgi:hypothetical protein
MSDLIEIRISRLERLMYLMIGLQVPDLIAVTQYSLIHDPVDNIERTF